MRFAVIGGDMRIARLAGLLSADGHDVSVFAQGKPANLHNVRCAVSVKDAVEGEACVVLPLPAVERRGFLSTPLSQTEILMEDVLSAIAPGTLVCAGRTDDDTRILAKRYGLSLVDYLEREELAVANAAATAEGAIGIIMQETPITVWRAHILVIGFGRIGKLLAHRLRGLCADIAVSARNCADITWIKALGYDALDTRELEGRLSGFDIVVNTAPALVLPENRLRELKPGALCLDLASKPGGMDFSAASRLGINAVWALSLPGKVAPESSGAIIRDTIYNIIYEQEEC